MIQLQWVVPEHSSTVPPRLQYRTLGGPGLGTWSDWLDVPTVVDRAAKPPAVSSLSEMLGLVAKNLDRGMSKSFQRLQARSIREVLDEASRKDAKHIPQPNWGHVFDAYVRGAKEARQNPEAPEEIFGKAADGYCKLLLLQLCGGASVDQQENHDA